MDSRQIEKILWANRWTQNSFIGCFPANRIPEINKFPASIVINLDTDANKGSHWVAAYIENKETIKYFDSFGPLNCLYPITENTIKFYNFCFTYPNSEIYDFLNKFKSITINKSIYQSILSENCGYFSIYFIYMMSIGFTFEKIMNILDKQIDCNYFVKFFVYKFVV